MSRTCPSPRATQILTLLADGRSYEQISRELFITKDTVKTHLRHAYEALGARNAPHAVALAIGTGLIPTPRQEQQ